MSHQVTLQPSGRSFAVAETQNVLEAALQQPGCVLPYGCRDGKCGSCVATLLEGTIDYPNGRPSGIAASDEAQGRILLCQAQPRSALVVQAHEIKTSDIAAKILPCRVEKRDLLAPHVMRLYLKLPSSERLQFLAGQYVDILLSGGRRRSFSLANPPHADDFLELHIRHVTSGLFSDYVFEQMQEKAILRFNGPLGTFFLREDTARPLLFIGGGTGFAPLKSMLEHAFNVGIQRPMHLYWGVRSRVDLYLDALPRHWVEQQAHFRYTPVLSAPQPQDNWSGRTGWVHAAVTADYADLSGYDVYMSGPPAMIAAAKPAFAAQGLPPEQLFYDSFEFSGA